MAPAGQVEDLIGARVTTIAGASATEVGGARIAAGSFISAFYGLRQNRAAWFATPAGDELFAQIYTAAIVKVVYLQPRRS